MKMNLVKTALFVLASSSWLGQAAQPLPVVEVETVQQKPLQSEFVGHGNVYGKQNVILTAGASGLLTFVAEPGQGVEKGEVVAKIDLLPLQLQQAEQRALLKRAEISHRFQTKELARLEALSKVDAAARSAFDQTLTQAELAESDIEIAKIKLKQLQDQIDRAVVKAPFKGIISQRYVKAGTDVNRAAELLSLIDTQQQEVRMYVPMRYFPFLALGQPVNISSGNLELAQRATALVSSIIPLTDTRSQTFEVRAELSDKDLRKWATGQLVDITLPIEQKQASTLINRDALLLRPQGTFIVKIADTGVAERLKVQVAAGQGQLVAVDVLDEGQLQQGDRVAIRGAEGLQTGQEVEIKASAN